MKIKFYIKLMVCLLTVKFAFADVVDVNNEQIVELSKTNIPIVDVRSSSEWDQTGVIPTSILLTFFDKEGNYDLDEWYEKLRLEIDEDVPIILICRSGNRSRIIADMMDKEFDNVIYNAKRGITSWIDEKLIIVKPQIN
ncbi:rhodanese-like domain-containing protein [Alphaproteobacteria bacterium]|jgi:rhodanese-related sulfurtransferase|nr:rhodanese-like domain-containing protein [Alphaproteobacteria bacterium]